MQSKVLPTSDPTCGLTAVAISCDGAETPLVSLLTVSGRGSESTGKSDPEKSRTRLTKSLVKVELLYFFQPEPAFERHV